MASFPNLYVWGCNKYTTEDDVGKKLKETLKIDTVTVVQKSNEDAYCKSFQVQFSTQSDFDQAVSNPEAWPEGVCVRKWVQRRKKPTGAAQIRS